MPDSAPQDSAPTASTLSTMSTLAPLPASSLSGPGYDPWAGHFGHLTSAQEESLTKFKALLVEAKVYVPASESSDGRASHDDPTLIRFLRARRWDPPKALKQFSDTESWRKKHDVERLYAEFDTEEFESSRRYYPRWTGRRDKGGRPVYVYRLASIEPFTKEIHAVSAERRYQRIVALYETMMRFTAPLCTYLPHSDGTILPESQPNGNAPVVNGTSETSTSPHKSNGPPITSTFTIIDLSSVSLTSMWSLRSHLQEASKLATANYPETLHAIVIVNAPGFFGKIWGWISNWFDEVTRNKISILSAAQVSDPVKNNSPLFQLVDKENIPKEYGGDLDWTFLDGPALDEEAKQVLALSKGTESYEGDGMPRGPWIFDLESGRVMKAKAGGK